MDGRYAVYTKALDATGKETPVYARPDVDIDDLLRIGRAQRIVGVSYVTDMLHVQYTDPDIAAIAQHLSHALPSLPVIRIVDASDNERRLLILASSDVDPGRYFLLDRDTSHLQTLMQVRPQLDTVPLAPVKSVSYPAADGTLIPAYLTLPRGSRGPSPMIVMPHGGPSARDEWGFDWLAQFFAARGFAVLQPNYRGSAGYGDQFMRSQGFRQWRTAIGDINSGARWAAAQGIADPARLAIFGWSYGGYAALQAGAIDPDLYKAIVAVAPVTDVTTLGGTTGMGANRKEIGQFRFGDAEGEASPINNAARITAPVMLVHGTFDRTVFPQHTSRMAARLAAAGRKPKVLTFDALDHQLDDSAARAKLLEESEAFIRKAIGG